METMPMMFYNLAESGKRIRDLRLESGLSQEQLGKKLGLAQQASQVWNPAEGVPRLIR